MQIEDLYLEVTDFKLTINDLYEEDPEYAYNFFLQDAERYYEEVRSLLIMLNMDDLYIKTHEFAKDNIIELIGYLPRKDISNNYKYTCVNNYFMILTSTPNKIR